MDNFIKKHSIAEIEIFRKGEPRINARPNSDKHSESGFSILISDANFNKLPDQINDAISYLSDQSNTNMIRHVSADPEVDGADLVFSVETESPDSFPVQSFLFPDVLTKLSGNLGLNIELSIFL